MQTTLQHGVEFKGTGLHSGRPAVLRILPAPENHGIVFYRKDIKDADGRVPATWNIVDRTPLCTRLINDDGVSVSTVEHVMAALCGCGIHNALLELDGPEVPILDGSSLPFVRSLINAGRRTQSAPLKAIEVLEPVSVSNGDATAALKPSNAMIVQFSIDFSEAAIGRQDKELILSNGALSGHPL